MMLRSFSLKKGNADTVMLFSLHSISLEGSPSASAGPATAGPAAAAAAAALAAAAVRLQQQESQMQTPAKAILRLIRLALQAQRSRPRGRGGRSLVQKGACNCGAIRKGADCGRLFVSKALQRSEGRRRRRSGERVCLRVGCLPPPLHLLPSSLTHTGG